MKYEQLDCFQEDMSHNQMGWSLNILTMSRYPTATRITLTLEKDCMMSSKVVVEKAWME